MRKPSASCTPALAAAAAAPPRAARGACAVPPLPTAGGAAWSRRPSRGRDPPAPTGPRYAVAPLVIDNGLVPPPPPPPLPPPGLLAPQRIQEGDRRKHGKNPHCGHSQSPGRPAAAEGAAPPPSASPRRVPPCTPPPPPRQPPPPPPRLPARLLLPPPASALPPPWSEKTMRCNSLTCAANEVPAPSPLPPPARRTPGMALAECPWCCWAEWWR